MKAMMVVSGMPWVTVILEVSGGRVSLYCLHQNSMNFQWKFSILIPYGTGCSILISGMAVCPGQAKGSEKEKM